MARSTLLRIPDLRRGPRPVPVAALLPWRRLLAVSAIALATANCSTNPQKFSGPAGNGLDPKYGVKTSPRLYNEGDVIPKGGGRRFSGKPYAVAGRTYVPKEDARGYVREGLASWYGAAFHGRMTANGEVFDRHSIAAAHPTLPLPSYVRVTNTANGYSMVVRVNDRGPYHADRVMDVSEEVARALDFHNKGTARVRVAYLGKASIAGSDDRKLLATLRTDGVPAGTRSPVMVADLGPSEEPERFSRTTPAPLAFRPAPEREERDEVPTPRPVRAPIVLASAVVPVPAALQPAALQPAVRGQPFRPMPVRVAALNPAVGAPASTAKVTAKATTKLQPPRPAAASPHPVVLAQKATPVRSASTPAAMPASARLAMARLTAVATPPGASKPAMGGPAVTKALAAGHPGAQQVGRRHTKLAEIY